MTLEKIDQLLAEWRKKVNLVGQNLMDLHDLPTYQRLAGVSGFPKIQLVGVTEARVTPALVAMNELFQHFDLLVMTVDKATLLRSSIPRFLGSEQRVREIEQLLTGASIQLPAVQTPLAQRELLSADQTAHSIAPEQLLTVMTNTFQVAKDAVLAVDEAWSRLEATLANAEAESLTLQKLADSLGVSALSELVAVREQIASLRDRIESDPLGVSGDFKREIEPLIAGVKLSLQQLVKQQAEIRDNLDRCDNLLKQLMELHHEAETAFAESKEKVVDHSTLQTPIPQKQIDALTVWLTRLETKFTEGLLTPVRVGLENWIVNVKQYIAIEEKTVAVNKAPLELRRELRGRLDALKAKALARGRGEDATLAELAEQAKQLLYARPTPLDKAAELVSQYEKHLNSHSYSK